MIIEILGLGIWARGLTSYGDLVSCLAAAQVSPTTEFINPKPETIPARERRRAGLLINLAVMAAHQACEHAQVDTSSVPSVFVSAMGDTDITDYMCRKLTQPEKLLSPTKFHNSVHNAPSGYWSISAENRCPSTFVGGARQSFGAGLLEAASQAYAHNTPVLLVAYDIINHPPFDDILPIHENLACALVIAPEGTSTGQHGLNVTADLELTSVSHAPVALPHNAHLLDLAKANPMGEALTLFECIADMETGQHPADHPPLVIAAAKKLALTLRLNPGA